MVSPRRDIVPGLQEALGSPKQQQHVPYHSTVYSLREAISQDVKESIRSQRTGMLALMRSGLDTDVDFKSIWQTSQKTNANAQTCPNTHQLSPISH